MGPSPVHLSLQQRTLVARFPASWRVLSWAPWNGGWVKASAVIIHQEEWFEDHQLEEIFRSTLSKQNLPQDTVGMLTGAEVRKYQEVSLTRDSLWVHTFTTMGLSNARSAGDPADCPQPGVIKPGTINLVLVTNALPNLQGCLEATHTATMAKTASLIEGGILSKSSGNPATGTGTDCITIVSSGEIPGDYCGMHTPLGELIGKSVRQVIKSFLEDQA